MGALTLRSHLAEKGLLDRFEERAIAWAEAAGVRWIELEGEFLTPAFHLAEVKGVQPEDFSNNAKLVRLRPYPEKKDRASEGLSRLLALPGVEACRVPTAYTVEGGYAISCRGAGRPDDVVSLVRQQWPDWNTNRSRFLLLNLPLALSYLLHGTSEAAKATRDLTIGTTIDLGKAAAARENAPLAVGQFSDDKAITAQLAKLMAMIHASHTRTEQRVDHVEADIAGVKIELAGVKGLASKAMALQDAHGRPKWMQVCEAHGVKPLESWLHVNTAFNKPPAEPGVYVIFWSDPERPLYVGMASGRDGLLGRLTGKHDCLRYLRSINKPCRIIACPTEFSGMKLKNLERDLQYALQPDWEYGGRLDHWNSIKSAMAAPCHQLGLSF